MEIKLECSQWFIDNGNEYFIEGNKEDGYQVTERIYDNETEDLEINIVYESKDFEECLTWCYNS
jgi:hypothetical protein